MAEDNVYFHHYSQMGDFYPLDIFLNNKEIRQAIKNPEFEWVQYNRNKPEINRKGLSLFSLDGSTSGEIDLNSVAEFNQINGTQYDEMSFRAPTKYWEALETYLAPLKDLEPHLGRSHFISLGEGGYFPPHRDLDTCFRLICFFDNSDDLYVVKENERLHFSPGRLYFLNTQKSHALFNFFEESILLVLNVDVNKETFRWVQKHLKQK